MVLCGVPFQYSLSYELRARLLYLQDTFGIQEGDFLNFDALRHASQCIGRVIRSKNDYGVMVLADLRYGKAGKREKIPSWIRRCIDSERHLDLSVDDAVREARRFLLEMS